VRIFPQFTPKPKVWSIACTVERQTTHVKELTHIVFGLVRLFGGFSLLIVGILDSSFLFMPLGNDLLLIALTAKKHSIPLMLYYAGMSTAGSVLGCLLVDLVFRKAGEEGLDKHLPKRRLDSVKNKVRKGAAWALAVASIAPPPFPFTPVIMAAAALEYPRKKLLTVVGAVRMVRFTGLGVLALLFGRSILSWGEQAAVQWFILGMLALFVIGSVFSVIRWIRHSRQRHPVAEPG
jgi:membrane protein YqaA with SNARE-associated domain